MNSDDIEESDLQNCPHCESSSRYINPEQMPRANAVCLECHRVYYPWTKEGSEFPSLDALEDALISAIEQQNEQLEDTGSER